MPKIPININTGEIKKEEMIVGIDLGTTNSLVAAVDQTTSKPFIIADEGEDVLVPSVIHFNSEQRPFVGHEAKPFLIDNPLHTIYSAKRLMGKSYQDLDQPDQNLGYEVLDDNTDTLVKVKVDNRFYSPIELSAILLRSLKQRAEKALSCAVSRAVITVPAYFNDTQRQATRDAGKLAGLDVMRIINEPTAASLAYGIGLDKSEERTVAVYDLGGGTFDVSVLTIEDGVFEVLATHGDTHLGGDDIDRAIVNHWAAGIGSNLNAQERRLLRLKAEEAKKQLSEQDEVSVQVEIQGENKRLALSKSELASLSEPLLSRTLNSCKQALKDAELTHSDLDEVILVGGSTRMPLVQEAVANFFQGVTINDSVNPDEVVALGAAIEADVLAGNRKDVLLLDVTPLSLGIETMGGLMDVILPRNSKVPIKAGREYTTSVDGQSGMKISVYQGERETVAENRKLAEFELTGIPAMPAGLPKVAINFMLDADGILQVSAKEQRSGVEQTISVKPQYGLTDEQVESMLLDSLQHAEEDMQFRAVAEARSEAEQLIYLTERFMEKNRELLSDEEVQGAQERLMSLKDVLSSEDKDEILSAHDSLNKFTTPFAERTMDDAVKGALKGKNIES